MKQVRTFEDLVGRLQTKSASDRKASVKSAGGPDATDPQEKGTVAIPKDPAAAPAKQQVPESKTNADETPVLNPPSAKVITGEEKPDLAKKASQVAEAVRKAMSLHKSAATTGKQGDPIATTAKSTGHSGTTAVAPNMPPNTQVNKDATGGDAGPKDPTQKDAPKPSSDPLGAMPPEVSNTDSKKASIEDLAMDPDTLIKLASIIVATEEGRQFALAMAEKEFGASVANDYIKAAMLSEQMANELAQEEIEGQAAAEEMWKNASENERQTMLKVAQVHQEARATLATPLEVESYELGIVKAAAMGDAGMLEEAPPAAMADPEAITIEDIVGVLDQLVQSGQLTPEVAEQVLTQLAGGGEGGGAPVDPAAGGALPMDPMAGSGALPPEAAAPPAAAPAPEAPPEGGGGGEKEPKSEPKSEPKDDDSKKEASLKNVMAEVEASIVII